MFVPFREVSLKLQIEKLVQGGDGLARLQDGRVCFVKGALPGETVRVSITENRKDFCRAELVEVLEKSLQRITPNCPLYGVCGGCSMQHISFEAQLECLKNSVQESFTRIGKTTLKDFPIHHTEAWHYRNRARFFKHSESGNFAFKAKASNGLVPIESCPILSTGLQEFIQDNTHKKIKAKELRVFDNACGKVSYYYKGMSSKEQEKHSNNLVYLHGKTISMDASVFFQSNLSILELFIDRIRHFAASGDYLIDLYSGVGFFSSFLEDSFSKVITVERDPRCLRHAKYNLGPKAISVTDNAEEWLLKNAPIENSFLIVDPPRGGLSPALIQSITKSKLKKMLYVSCNPVSLARDSLLLQQSGLHIHSAESFAFYPQTAHLEMFLYLERD